MKNNKTNGAFLVIIVLLIIVGIGAIGYFISHDEANTNTEVDNNKTSFNEVEERENLNTNIKDIERSLGWLAVVSSIENYNAGGDYEVVTNKDFLEDISNRQLFVMEQILNNTDSYKDFIVLNGFSLEETDELDPTDETSISYYPYDLFNIEYKKYFGEDFKVSKAKVSNSKTKYDSDSNYVYYENKRSGANGLYVSSITIENVEYDTNTKTYTASISLNYSERAIQNLGIDSNQATLSYLRDNDSIILKSLIVK